MAENADTSASAGSSGAKLSSPGLSGTAAPEGSPAPQGTAPPGSAAQEDKLRVDFYVLEESAPGARLRVACRLAEKAYLSGQSALLWHSDPDELRSLDELLWTFMDGSFVPHEALGTGTATAEVPVLLSAGAVPAHQVDVIINLAPEIPPCLAQTRRVAEIIDGDEARRRAGRARFRAYRELGIQPASHNVRGD
ncbi:MAG TPA: DNA polymerase III subunit chi [Steroidobacteraceae bacterium]|nr:DNA polymerase III subunit chi [Steroidobacteraceae bacterium]